MIDTHALTMAANTVIQEANRITAEVDQREADIKTVTTAAGAMCTVAEHNGANVLRYGDDPDVSVGDVRAAIARLTGKAAP